MSPAEATITGKPHPIECPRCGYELAAALEPARAAGRGHVVCPECGLDSEIAALERDAAFPRWSIESPRNDAASITAFVARFIGTARHALRPPSFWRAMRMDTPFSPRGVLAFAAGVVILLHLACAIAMVPNIVMERVNRGVAARVLVPDFALAAVFPYCPAFGGDIMIAAAHGDAERGISPGTLWRFVSGAAQLTVTRTPISFRIVPRSIQAKGLYAFDGPLQFDSHPNAFSPDDNLRNLRRFLRSAVAVGLIPVGASALLLLLPATLRRARVKHSHLVRAAVYGLVLLPLAVLYFACVLASASLAQANRGFDVSLGWLMIAGLLAVFAFSITSLHAVMRHYLRLPRILLVNTLLHIVLLFALFLLFATLN